jgi:hypothetical protein
MVLMYDSVTASAIPANAAVAACYIDGAYANEGAVRAQCPHAVIVRIAVFPSTHDGHVIDCEQGDATPQQAFDWVVSRRAADPPHMNLNPIVYCNASTWPAVRAVFAANPLVPPPLYWIAQYDGVPTIPAGAVAKQYADPPNSGGNYDVSNVSQAFIDAVTGGTVTTPSQPQADDDTSTLLNWWINTPHVPGKPGRQVKDVLGDGERILDKLDAVLAAVGAADADVKTEGASVLAAIAAGQQVNLTDAQVTALAAQVEKGLPGYVVNITPAPAAN